MGDQGNRWREAQAFAQIGAAGFALLALWSYSPDDKGFGKLGNVPVANYAGTFGAWFADFLHFFLGHAAWVVPLLLIAWGVRAILISVEQSSLRTGLGIAASCVLLCAVATQMEWWGGWSPHCVREGLNLPCGSGGWLGIWLLPPLFNAFGLQGTQFVLWTTAIVCLSVSTGFSWLALADIIGAAILRACAAMLQNLRETAPTGIYREGRSFKPAMAGSAGRRHIDPNINIDGVQPTARQEPTGLWQGMTSRTSTDNTLHAPGTDLLSPNEQTVDDDFEGGHTQEQLTSLLTEYGVAAEVVSYSRGPVITRFEVEPKAGVKASRISALSTDIARSMRVAHVRVVEVSPGKSTVGIEVPNKRRSAIGLRSLLDSELWHDSRSALSLALGVDIEGNPVIAQLDDMPHLLVAGTTGSGKSVSINSMLLSILYKASPEEVRLLLVDPKMLELSIYEGVPHLLAPVITDMRKASAALSWCVIEMDRRYRLLASLGVRDIRGYNDQILAAKQGKISLDMAFNHDDELSGEGAPPANEPLPFIVVVIDEFADMIMSTAKRSEEMIIRLTQKARAAGIHLILATQRPSVNVITGLIKANVPARLALQVASSIDSRTVLDQNGAEQLLGAGDMLYMRPGTQTPQRVHGAMVRDEEVHRVVEHYRSLAAPQYIDEVMSPNKAALNTAMHGGSEQPEGSADEEDEMYPQAVDIVLESGRASASLVQRRLRVGYNRAARLLDIMEQKGIVSGADSRGAREILSRKSEPQLPP
jgi:S-DNA-T family DNA segregation ATPase FtsK/SpoIIIE